MTKRLTIALLLAGVVQIAAAGPAVIGAVSAQHDVYVSGLGSQQLAVQPHSSESLVSGDVVSTRGLESWGAVRLGRAGLVEVGPDSAIGFDRVDGALQVSIIEGGFRYSLEQGESLIVEAPAGRVLLGPAPATGVVKVAAALGAAGAVVVDDGRLLVKNTGGEMTVVDEAGNRTAIPIGQLLAFQAGAVGSSSPSFQVGAARSAPAFTPTEQACKQASLPEEEQEACKKAGYMTSSGAGGMSPGKKAAIILGSTAAAFGIRELVKDDNPPGSPR